MTDSANCLHHLLPPARDSVILNKLCDHRQYCIPNIRTARFRNSFLVHAFRTYQ